MQSNGRPRIQMPGAVDVELKPVPGPWAAPVVIPVAVDGGVKTIVAGGLTREEMLAAPILGALLGLASQEDAADPAELADAALSYAETLLARSAARATARAEAAQKPKIEGV